MFSLQKRVWYPLSPIFFPKVNNLKESLLKL